MFASQSQGMADHLTNSGQATEAHSLTATNHFTVVDWLKADADGPVREFLDEQLGLV